MTWTASRGARLDERYELEEQIGVGGMGEVWRARHLALKNAVAIKFLSGALAAKKETRERFQVEAEVTAKLRSRNAVQVFDFGVTEEGQPYLVLELLHGETLAARSKRLGKLPPAQVVKIIRAASRALARAHALGIVHRDFKPDNVFLEEHEEGEEVKVVDFGIAKLIGNLEEARPSPSIEELTSKSLTSLTRTNSFIGTPQYMSPEQVRQEKDVGPATDIWSLAVVAFEALTGQQPFDGNTVVALFSNIQLGNRRSAHAIDPSIPAQFDAWFAKATALDIKERFSDATAAANALADALAPVTGRVPMGSMLDDASLPDLALASTVDGSAESIEVPVSKPARSMGLAIAVVAVLAIGAGIGGVAALRASTSHPTAASPTPAPTPSPTLSNIPPPPDTTAATAPSVTASTPPAATTVAEVPRGGRHSGGGGGKTSSAPTTTTTTSTSTAATATTGAPPAKPTSSSPFALPPLGL